MLKAVDGCNIWITADLLWSNVGHGSMAHSSEAVPKSTCTNSDVDVLPVNLAVHHNTEYNALVCSFMSIALPLDSKRAETISSLKHSVGGR